MKNLARVPKSPIFWDFAKNGTKGKAPKKKADIWGFKNSPLEMRDIYISMVLTQTSDNILFQISVPKVPAKSMCSNFNKGT